MYLILLNDWKHNRDFHILPVLTVSAFNSLDISFAFLAWRVTWVVMEERNGFKRRKWSV